jgi:hypothetical protein
MDSSGLSPKRKGAGAGQAHLNRKTRIPVEEGPGKKDSFLY